VTLTLRFTAILLLLAIAKPTHAAIDPTDGSYRTSMVDL